MTLRVRILTLFGLLGVVPILALGGFNYVRSMQAVEALLEAETAAIARRIVADLEERYALRASELLLVAENVETQRLFNAHAKGMDPVADPSLVPSLAYLASVWELVRPSYRWIELRDGADTPLHRLGEVPSGLRVGPGAGRGDVVVLAFPVPATDGGGNRGQVVAAVRANAILPAEILDASFGRAGYTVVLDRAAGTVLHHPSRRFLNQGVEGLLGADGWRVGAGAFAADSGRIRYAERDSSRVASFLRVRAPPWTVLASAAVDEFAGPFLRTRTANLLVMLLVAGGITAAFLLMTRRATASLQQLTVAADEVARGEFSPRIPEGGGDEVGRLSRAFRLMVEEVRRMLQRVEETRDMAVMGEFASQISHEIRNPLTSIKLNLQSLGRDVETGRIPHDAAAPVRISLREVARLERTVQRVLGMARTHTPTGMCCSVHEVLEDALEAVASQLAAQDVVVERHFNAPEDRVRADPEDLEGAFVNLLINAAEAMPSCGTIRVSTSVPGRGEQAAERWLEVRIADEGPGIPPEIRGQIFRPFVSTKPSSTGFGLALARRAVEAHGGRIQLAANEPGERGATFAVEFPVEGERSERLMPAHAHAEREE